MTLAVFFAVTGCGSSSSESCSCEVTINGLKKTSTTCGEKLCFADDAYVCRPAGAEFVAKGCATTNSGGGGGAGGGMSTGGGLSGMGGGMTATGGGGGSSGTGGGMAGTGGGTTHMYTCTGMFMCGTKMCDAATQYCFDYDGLADCEDFSSNTCSARDQWCVSWTAGAAQVCVTNGLRGSCTVDPVTGAVRAVCK
ncbi:MAG: hypothetical protein K1X64_01425 [Myxococcaceae bacterium]|nr:hypothetical protein [Myxococcaceae bacterium]